MSACVGLPPASNVEIFQYVGECFRRTGFSEDVGVVAVEFSRSSSVWPHAMPCCRQQRGRCRASHGASFASCTKKQVAQELD